MDILKTIKNTIGGGAGNKQNDLMATVLNLVGGKKGGLGALIGLFTSKGLGDVIGSWVGRGKNQAISPDQIQSVLGSGQIKNIASKHGMNTNEVKSQLSNLLPQVVDKLTPNGKVPEGDIMSKGMDILGSLFGKK